MTTRTPTRPNRTGRNQRSRAVAAARAAAARRQRRRGWLLWGITLGIVAAVLGGLMWTARTTSDASTRTAPDFTLTDTAGHAVHLADYRGHNVVLYFSEGAGCQACLLQMTDVEQHRSDRGDAHPLQHQPGRGHFRPVGKGLAHRASPPATAVGRSASSRSSTAKQYVTRTPAAGSAASSRSPAVRWHQRRTARGGRRWGRGR